jgi:glycosyltransferase involved in cell wall biosynthesis
MGERVLVIGHGHPEKISGGGEIAAYNCWREYAKRDDVDGSWFLARGTKDSSPGGASGRMQFYRKDQYLWDQGLSDPFMMRAANLHEVTGYFADLVQSLRPSIVHSHHYFMLGLEYLKILKDIDPNIRTVLTLHEYMAICPNSGLMMNSETRQLCKSGAYDRHVNCAPDRTAEDLWLRFNRFKRYFAYVDHFVAPSHFLRDRYVEWGIPADRISVIRNGMEEREKLPARDLGANETRNRFAFFGQFNPHKGVDMILRGLKGLPSEQRHQIRFEIHGANLELQPDDYRKEMKKLLAPLVKQGVVQVVGPYDQTELAARMAGVDWVMVPSVWYENAPLVIQEAFGLGRPVLTTDIGGMQEAVDHGVSGYCLPRGSSAAWVETMIRISKDTAGYDEMLANLPVPLSWADSVAQHMQLFAELSKRAA